jgi:TonB family protein
MSRLFRRVVVIVLAVLINSAAISASGHIPLAQISNEVTEKARASIVFITGEDSSGQSVPPGIGFWISNDLVATEDHVTQYAAKRRVTIPGQETSPMDVSYRDCYRHVTILTVRAGRGIPMILGDGNKVAANDKLYLISTSDSQVSATETSVANVVNQGESRYFQLATPMPTGRGGPVLNANGEVIGIQGEGPDGKGYGYALPSSFLRTLLKFREPLPSTGPGSGGQPGSDDHSPSSGPTFTRAVLLNTGRPQYNEQARQNYTQGVVIMWLSIGADGEVKQVRVTKGLPDGLNEQAIATAMKLKFKPATRDGVAVPSTLNMTVDFNLR